LWEVVADPARDRPVRVRARDPGSVRTRFGVRSALASPSRVIVGTAIVGASASRFSSKRTLLERLERIAVSRELADVNIAAGIALEQFAD
jgi:hypothetical protein